MGLGLFGAITALVFYKLWLAPHIFGAINDSFHQAQCLNNLSLLLQPEDRLPELGGWAASPDLALLLVETIRDEKPLVVVELGSGATTTIIRLALKRFSPDARFISIEQEAEHTSDGIRHVPIRDGWYDTDLLQDLSDIDLLFVDGPRGSERYPALPFFADRLSPKGVVLVDDANRKDDRAYIDRWQNEFPHLSVAFLDFQKGAAVLRA